MLIIWTKSRKLRGGRQNNKKWWFPLFFGGHMCEFMVILFVHFLLSFFDSEVRLMELKQRFFRRVFFFRMLIVALCKCCPFWKLAFARQQLMKDLKENPKLTQELLRNLLLCCSTLFQRSIHAADQRFARLSSSHCHVVLGQNHVFYSMFEDFCIFLRYTQTYILL